MRSRLSDAVGDLDLSVLSQLQPAFRELRRGAYVRRVYQPMDHLLFEARADFVREWACSPRLSSGPKWSIHHDTLGVLGVGGLTLLSEGSWELWGFSADLDARGWAAVRWFAADVCAWSEAALDARLIRAGTPANRPEAAALLVRLGFEPSDVLPAATGDFARIMERRA